MPPKRSAGGSGEFQVGAVAKRLQPPHEQQTGYSPYHFARLFQCTTGETPHHFVLRQRIERAQRLLAETALPLARIAGESGFANQSAFTRVFTRSVGVTPRVYRQERAN